MDKFFSSALFIEIAKRWSDWIVNKMPSLLIIFLLGIAFFKIKDLLVRRSKTFIMSRAIGKEKRKFGEFEKRVDTLLGIVNSTFGVFIWILLVMIVLKKLGVDIAPLIAGAGIIGIAVGFGAQELVRDIISGFFQLLENQVRQGDVAIINGTGGLVENIGLRTITLRDFSGVVHVFQNGKINTLSNMTKDWSAMVFDIGVAYKENVDDVISVMREVGEELVSDESFSDNILEPLEIFGVDKFDDSAVVIKARLKTVPIKQWDIGREFRKRLKAAFDEKNIEIPFPHTTLYWGDKIAPLKVEMKP